MITWNDYKKYVRETDPEAADIITAAELEAESIPIYPGFALSVLSPDQNRPDDTPAFPTRLEEHICRPSSIPLWIPAPGAS